MVKGSSNRRPLLDRTNDMNNKMSSKESSRRSTRVRKSTDWKRRLPGEISPKVKKISSPAKKLVKSNTPTKISQRIVRGRQKKVDKENAMKANAKLIKNGRCVRVSVERSEEVEEKIKQILNLKELSKDVSEKEENSKKLQTNQEKNKSHDASIKQSENVSTKSQDVLLNTKKSQVKSKRIASKKAISQIVKQLRVSLERNSILEEKLQNSIKDIYEFTFDPLEEPKVVKKGRRRKILDESGDADNSMKNVMKRLRKKEHVPKKRVKPDFKVFDSPSKNNKVPSKTVKINSAGLKVTRNASKNIKQPLKTADAPNLINDRNIKSSENTVRKNLNNVNNNDNENLKVTKNASKSVKQPVKTVVLNLQNNTKIITSDNPVRKNLNKVLNNTDVQKQLTSATNIDLTDKLNTINPLQIVVEEDSENYDDNYDYMHTPSDNNDTIDTNQNKTLQKTIQEEICDSFMEEFIDETNTSLQKSNLLTNDVLKSLNVLKESLNGTKNKVNVISNVVVRQKNSSQQKIFNSTSNSVLGNSSPWRLNVSNVKKHTFTTKNTSFMPNYDQDLVINSTLTDKFEEKSTAKKNELPKIQSSILNFISSSKGNKKEYIAPGGLFTSPRKILGEINFVQSTPFQPIRKIASPNISVISSGKVSPIKYLSSIEDTENGIRNCFGFDEDSENINPKSLKNLKTKRSPRKEKLKTVLFNDEVEVVPPEKIVEGEELPSADIDLLFKDVENDKEKLRVKKSRRSYERTKPKRKRLPSFESSYSSDEGSIIEVKVKKPTKRTKKEEEEVAKLASQYNSMFEEIEKHNLLIE